MDNRKYVRYTPKQVEAFERGFIMIAPSRAQCAASSSFASVLFYHIWSPSRSKSGFKTEDAERSKGKSLQGFNQFMYTSKRVFLREKKIRSGHRPSLSSGLHGPMSRIEGFSERIPSLSTKSFNNSDDQHTNSPLIKADVQGESSGSESPKSTRSPPKFLQKLHSLHPFKKITRNSSILPMASADPLTRVDEKLFKGSAMTKRDAYAVISYMTCAGIQLQS